MGAASLTVLGGRFGNNESVLDFANKAKTVRHPLRENAYVLAHFPDTVSNFLFPFSRHLRNPRRVVEWKHDPTSRVSRVAPPSLSLLISSMIACVTPLKR